MEDLVRVALHEKEFSEQIIINPFNPQAHTIRPTKSSSELIPSVIWVIWACASQEKSCGILKGV